MSKKPIPTAAAAPADPSLAAFIESEVERAMKPYVGLFPEEVLEGFRERLAMFYATHPATVPLVEAARPRGAPDGSGVMETLGSAKPAADSPETERAASNKRGAKR